RHNQLLIHIEPELRSRSHNQKSIGGAIAALNGAGWSPVDQREPVERVVADGAHKAILTPAVDLQHIKLALSGIETEDQAVDISMQQLRLRGNHHIRVLLLAGVAPRDLPRDEGTH